MDNFFPTLFTKTFFIVGVQLFITWATTHFTFSFFKKIDPAIGKRAGLEFNRMAGVDPHYRWVFGTHFFYALILVDVLTFLALYYWGIHQSLLVSLGLFSFWSFLTGIQLEYLLLDVDEGLGRKVLALTASIVLGTALIGIYSTIDFGFLQIPLFIALMVLLVINIGHILGTMQSVSQRLTAGFGVFIFTLYLVLDFNSLTQKEAEGVNGWETAMRFAIKIYLDIINLFLQLLQLLSKHH